MTAALYIAATLFGAACVGLWMWLTKQSDTQYRDEYDKAMARQGDEPPVPWNNVKGKSD